MSLNQETRTREHLANERTFLAWIRTSIAIMAFGFVVEKFSLFIREMAAFLGHANLSSSSVLMPGVSATFGIVLIAFGVLICLVSFIKYWIILKQIEMAAYQPSIKLNILLTLFIILLGLLLVIYLSVGI